MKEAEEEDVIIKNTEEREEDKDNDSGEEYEEGNEPIFYTTRDSYRLVHVVRGSVGVLKSHMNKLDTANNELSKQVQQQTSVIFELRSQMHLLTQQFKK